MLSDLFNRIVDKSVRQRLLEVQDPDIICYPGCGVDIISCLMIENQGDGLPEFDVADDRVYFFCDPSLDSKQDNSTVMYREIPSIFSEGMDVIDEVISGEEIYDYLKGMEIFESGITSWKNDVEMRYCSTISINNPVRKRKDTILYMELSVNNSVCRILVFPYMDTELWDLFSYYDVEVKGVFLWNPAFLFPNDIIENGLYSKPKWVFTNRSTKCYLPSDRYKYEYVPFEQVDKIVALRGNGNSDRDVAIFVRCDNSSCVGPISD